MHLHPEETAIERELEALETSLARADAPLAARATDAAATLDAVQRYLESERNRSRRVVVWTSTIFLFVVLLVLTLFIAVGIYVVGQSHRTTEIVDAVEGRTSTLAAQTEGLVDRLGDIEQEGRQTLALVDEQEAGRVQEKRVLQSDLERFSQWISATDGQHTRQLDELTDRLKALQTNFESREEVLQEVRDQYAALKAELAAPAPLLTAAAADPSTGAMWERPPGRDEPGAAPAQSTAPAQTPAGAITTVRFPNGDRYEGEFRDGLLNGWGVYFFGNGDRYEGQFRDDMKHGYGTLRFHNGDVYKGQFQDDARHGHGTYLFAAGAKYIGEFRSGRRHGRGRYVFEDGQEYVGEFRDGRIADPGVTAGPDDGAPSGDDGPVGGEG